MKKYILISILFAGLVACQNNTEKKAENSEKAEKIKTLKKEIASLNAEANKTNDEKVLQQLALKYQETAKEVEADSSVAMLLTMSAYTYARLNETLKAMDLFTEVAQKYPQSKYAAEALFNKAFMTETVLKDTASALVLYHDYLQKYPKHVLAESVKENVQKLEETRGK